MQKLIDERETGDFKSLKDVEERVPSVPDPKKAIRERIMNEMKGETKHKLFTS
jgi:predicted nucleic acid-binding OB-fold protein